MHIQIVNDLEQNSYAMHPINLTALNRLWERLDAMITMSAVNQTVDPALSVPDFTDVYSDTA